MVHNRHAEELDVLHGVHPFPATATSAWAGLPAK